MKKILITFLSVISLFSISDDSVEMETVEIIGNQDEVSGSASVITNEDLELYEYTDIHKILSNVPGVNFRPEEGYGLRPNISIRGTYGDRSGKVTLMEDGVLIAPAPYAASSAYYFPTAGRIHSVEVLKGPAAITQGPYTVGGAINLISTPIPEMNSGLVNFELGQDGTRRTHLHYGTNSDNVGFLVETHMHDTDGFDSIRGGGDTGFDKDDVLLKLRLNSDPNADVYHELNIKYQDSEEISDQTYVGLADADFRNNPHERYGLTAMDEMDNAHDQMVFNYVLDMGDLEMSATVYENDFARDWFKVDKMDNGDFCGAGTGIDSVIGAANAGDACAASILAGTNTAAVDVKLKHNNRKYISEGTDLKLRYQGKNHTLTVGYRDTEDSEDRVQWYENSDWFGGTMSATVVGSLPGYSSNNRITTADATAFYINDEFSMGNLTVNLGYRSEDWEISQDRFVDAARSASATANGYPKELVNADNNSFGVGLNYDIDDDTSIFLGFHEGFTPNASNSADPEDADNLEIGLRRQNDNSTFEIVYFDTDYKNMLGSCTASGGAVGECEIGDQYNAGAASISGLEISVDTSMTSENGTIFPVSLRYTSTDAEFNSTFTSDFWGDVAAGDDLPDTPDTQLALSGGFITSNDLRGSATLYSFGSTCSVASCDSGTQIDSYKVIDFSLTKKMSEELDIYLVINNITDEEDIVARAPKNGARAQMPRSAVVGLRYRL